VSRSASSYYTKLKIFLKERFTMINYEEEINRFKPSLDVDQIEDAIVKVDLTDMNDIMTKLIEDAIKQKKDAQK